MRTVVWSRARSEVGARTTILLLTAGAFAMFALAIPGFASPRNLVAIVLSALPLLLLATGQTFVLISAGIDLSATAIVGLASIAGGLVMTAGTPDGAPGPIAGVLVMLGVGAAMGLVNGASVGGLGMPAFMVTLTSGMFAAGVAVWLPRIVANTDTIFGLPQAFVDVGATPWMAAAAAVGATLAAHGALRHTVFGRQLYASGCNPRAALVSGVRVGRIVAAAYVVSGVLAAVAAILMTGALETASPTHARTLLLDVIGATVIGGTSLAGGRGSIGGTALGVVFLALVGNGLTLLNLSDFLITIVKGLLILAAALIDAARNAHRG